MKKFPAIPRSEEGFVLVTSMVTLIALTLIGIAAIMTSTVEVRIAGNDRLHKETFYHADGDTNAGFLLTFENAKCTDEGGFTMDANGKLLIGNNMLVHNKSYAESRQGTPDLPADPDPADATVEKRDAVYYSDGNVGDDTLPHTNFTVNGRARLIGGTGLQMISGYEGLGYGAASGGFNMRYLIHSQRVGELNSQSTISTEWRIAGNLLRFSDDCNF